MVNEMSLKEKTSWIQKLRSRLVKEKKQKLCSCDSIPMQGVKGRLIEGIGLTSGQGTDFYLFRCPLCDGWRGFPNDNFLLALKFGDKDAKEYFASLGMKLEDLQPSREKAQP